MAWEGYRSRLCKCNDFNVYGLFGRSRWEKRGSGGTSNEVGETINEIQRVQGPSGQSLRAGR
jgi:hypothetical protein